MGSQRGTGGRSSRQDTVRHLIATLFRSFLVALLVTDPAMAAEWSRYEAAGVAIDVPAGSFTIVRRQPNRLSLEDAGVGAALEIMTGDTGGMSIARFRKLIEAADPRRVITHHAHGGNWFVLSGYMPEANSSEQLIYYAKFLLRGGRFAAFEISYPRALKEHFDPVVSRLEASLSSGR